MSTQTSQQHHINLLGLGCLCILILSFASSVYGEESAQSETSSAKHLQEDAQALKKKIPSSIEKVDKPAKKITKVGQLTEVAPVGRGFTLALYTGLSSCIPSGNADCSNQYPGGVLGGSLGYRWTHVRLSIESDRSRLWISDATVSDTELASQTLLMSIYGYYPYKSWELFLGGGLGYGQMQLVDQPTQYGVSWSSLWQNTRLSFGAQRPLNSKLALEFRFILDLHLGGQYCSMINGIEKCIDPNDKFKGQSIDISHLAHLSVGIRY